MAMGFKRILGVHFIFWFSFSSLDVRFVNKIQIKRIFQPLPLSSSIRFAQFSEKRVVNWLFV